jgi:hypothetical protein
MYMPHVSKPTPALIIAVVALVVALAGTSYAALSLPKNSVGTRQLKNGAVTANKIKGGAVSASKLNLSGVTVPNAAHATNADTAGSATNAGHATAADTASSLNAVQIVDGTPQAVGPATQESQLVTCPTGTAAIGGNEINNGGPQVSLNEVLLKDINAPNDSVRVYVNNEGAAAINFTPYAYCLKGSVSGTGPS